MSDEFERMFASLADDADRAPRRTPADLRSHTNRRTVVRTTATLAVVAVAVAGTAVGGRLLLAGQQTPLPGPPAASGTPSALPSVTPSATPGGTPSGVAPSSAGPTSPSSSPSTAARTIPPSIPDKAFLTAADLRTGDAPTTTSQDMLPPLCPGGLPSDAQVGVRRTVHGIFKAPGTPDDHVPDGSVEQTVTVYRGDGAQQVIAELRAKVQACPTAGNRTFALAGPAAADALTFTATFDAGELEMGGVSTGIVSVFRVDDTVVILNIHGWENGSAETGDAQRLTGAARNRLSRWR